MSLGAPGKRCGPGVELGVGDGAGERGHLAVPIMRERAAEAPGLSFAERLGAGDLDFELLEPFEADLLAEAMHARNGDVGGAGELLDAVVFKPIRHGERRGCDLLLGGLKGYVRSRYGA